MSLDFNHAQDAVKNILDNSTGEFRDDFEAQAKDFVKLAQDAKVVTEAKVTAAAVDTMSDDNAVVLVAVNTQVTNTTGANKQPGRGGWPLTWSAKVTRSSCRKSSSCRDRRYQEDRDRRHRGGRRAGYGRGRSGRDRRPRPMWPRTSPTP